MKNRRLAAWKKLFQFNRMASYMQNRYSNISFKIIIALILSGYFANGCGSGNSKTVGRGTAGGKGVVSVEALVIHPRLLQNKINTTGTLLANEEVELRSEISGRVTGVNFEEGKRVHKGDLLLSINNQELQAQLKRKKLEEKQAADNETREKSLLDIKAVSLEEYNKYLNTLQMIQAEREVIESQLAKTEIIAPFDGIVGLRYISEGGYVTPNILVATMQEIDPLKVEFSVPERHAAQMKNGTEILVYVGDSEEGHNGIVFAVESKIDPDTRTIKARAKIPNPKSNLIPGSFAKIEITLEEIPNAVVIPTEAIIPQINNEIIYICQNGAAKSVPVKTGIRTEREIQISQGLNPDDTLIVSGLLQLADGKNVKITNLKNE